MGRWLATAVVLTTASLVSTSLPAQAGGRPPVATHISVTADPATAAVLHKVTFSGRVSPLSKTLVLRLQVAVGAGWHTVATTHASATGAYSLQLTTPGVPTTQLVRVVRWGSPTIGAGASKTTHLKVDATAFGVTARVGPRVLPAGGTLTVTGKVSPKGTGKVYLQRLTPDKTWVAVSSASLSSSSSYVVHVTVAQGSGTYRVLKPPSAQVATGSSPSVAITANSPEVTTSVTLPEAVVNQPYSAMLTADLGTPPYHWSAGVLPAGLTLLDDGAVLGRPVVPSDGALPYTVQVTVTDANGFTGTKALDLLVSSLTGMAWGNNSYGQLGVGTIGGAEREPEGSTVPALLTTMSSSTFNLAATTTGTVYSWGFNGGGQLGLSSTTNVALPTLVPTLSNIVAVSAGTDSGYAVAGDGSVWAWGANGFGQLGNGSTTPSLVPLKVPGLTDIVSVSAGDGYVLALRSDGSVVAWGDNADGQIGAAASTNPQLTPIAVDTLGGTANTRVVSLSAGQSTGYAVLADGRMAAWGDGTRGALGNGGTASSNTPIEVSNLFYVSTLACHDADDYCAALLSDGTVWTWGANEHGRLGNGTTSDTDVPEQVPGLSGVAQLANNQFDVYAVTATGTIEDWGDDSDDQIGHLTTLPDQLLPGANTDNFQPLQLFAGYDDAYEIYAAY